MATMVLKAFQSKGKVLAKKVESWQLSKYMEQPVPRPRCYQMICGNACQA